MFAPRQIVVSAFIVACSSLVTPTTGLADEKKCYELIFEASELPSNKISEKIKLYTQAIAELPQFYLAYQNRAVCHINHGDWDSAITDATDAIQRAPTEAVPWSVRARAYSGKRMFAKADSDIQTALARASSKPDKVQIFNEQGNIRFSANEYAKAIESYKKAIDLDPEFAKAWANMALAQRALGQTEEGVKSLDKALILDVNLSRGFTNKARFDVARNDKQAAVRNLDQAIKLDPNDYQSFLDRAMIRFVDGDYENARKDLEIAEQNRKENPYVAVWRYMTAAALKDEKALVDAKSYLARQKRLDLWPIPVLNVVEGSVKVEELLKASEFEGNRIAQKERAAEANFYLAMLAQLKGDKAEREKYLKASIEQSSPRVHEATLAKVMLEGWKTPVPEPPKSVNQDASPAPPKPVEPKKVD